MERDAFTRADPSLPKITKGEESMSINSLANAAAARRPDVHPLGTVPKGLDEIARAAMTPPSVAPPAPTPGEPPQQGSAPIDTALNVLFGYVPTEVLTLYVAALAAIQQPNKVTPGQ